MGIALIGFDSFLSILLFFDSWFLRVLSASLHDRGMRRGYDRPSILDEEVGRWNIHPHYSLATNLLWKK